MKKFFLFLVALVISCMSSLHAAYIEKLPVTLTQADGTTISCYASGDEFYNWLHDENNFTIIQNPEGYYCYAIKQGDNVVASQYRVGTVDPITVGISPGVSISAEAKSAIRKQFYENTPDISTSKNYRTPTGQKNIGALNNLVVYIKFADQTEFPEDTMYYWTMFNKTDDPSYQSLQNYFETVSYNKITIPSYFYPLSNTTNIFSYTDIHPREYYMPYHPVTAPLGYNENNNDRTVREHKLLKNAVDYIAGMVPADLNVDYDNDGLVDNIVFIIRGGTTAWATLLWPHMWALYNEYAEINGKQVWTFNFQLEEHLNQSQSSVLCHEMFHSLGAPDLYRYNENTITPIGQWDVMASNGNPAQSMSAYMKYKYGGWIDELPEITEGGTYTLHTPWSQTNNMYKIASPHSTNEFFLLEYRNKQHQFEITLPGEGLLIYRVCPSLNGNADGPPDELYVFRPGGYNTTTNGNVNIACFSADVGRTEFNDDTDPPCFLMNNQPGGIHIRNIGSAEETISFEVLFDGLAKADFYSDVQLATIDCNINFFGTTYNFVDDWYWEFEDGVPATSTEQNPTEIKFSQTGNKTIKLTVSNQYGTYTEEKEAYINISDEKPNADFYCHGGASYIGTQIKLFDNSDLCPIEWNWTFEPNTIEFAEGTNSNSQNPVIIPTSFAEYDVTLTVANVNGETTITKENYITTIGIDVHDYILDFEGGLTLEDFGVTVINPDNRLTWELIELSTEKGINHAAYVNFFKYNVVNQKDYLILPLLNFTDAYEMHFRHAYATRMDYSDTLIVSISIDGGSNWEQLGYYYEDNENKLATVTGHYSTNFLPNKDQWCGEENSIPCKIIDLSKYIGNQAVLIRFETVKIAGNNIFIDDISFVKKEIGIDEHSFEHSLKIYPNPSSGVYYIDIENIEDKYDIYVYDIVGNLILSDKKNIGNSNIDISGKKSGMYFIKIISNNFNKTIKVVKD